MTVNRCKDEQRTLGNHKTDQETWYSMGEIIVGNWINLDEVSKDSHNQVRIASKLHVCIRASKSKFQLILVKDYWYISFSNTPVDLTIMWGWMGLKFAFRLPLLENAITESFPTFYFILESFEAAIWAATVSVVVGRGLDDSWWNWRKTWWSVVNGRPLALGGWRQDGSSLLNLRPNRGLCKFRGHWEVIQQLPG